MDGSCVLSPCSLLCLCLAGNSPWYSGDTVEISILCILASPEDLEVELEVNNSFSVTLDFKPSFLSLLAALSLFLFLSANLLSSFFLCRFFSSPFWFVFLSFLIGFSVFVSSLNSLSGSVALDLPCGDCREQGGCRVSLYLTSENLDFRPA